MPLKEHMLLGIADAMQQVDALLGDRLRHADEAVREVVSAAAAYQGKRIRPALLLQSARAFGPPSRRHVLAAAAVELLHTATLVHDDVVDGARLRRGAPSLNVTLGNEMPIMLGDYLFAQTMVLVAQIGDNRAISLLADATRRVCQGEIHQLLRRGDFELSGVEYLRIVEHKTAALFAASCRVGAVLSGAGVRAAGALERFGRGLGVAFQIVDDCLDVAGCEAVEGKSLGSDLGNGKLTLPGILLLERTTGARRAAAVRALRAGASPAGRRRLAKLMDESGALRDALAMARQHVHAGRLALDRLPDSPARRRLGQIACFVLERSVSPRG